MALCKILVHYPNTNGWNVGDLVEISNSTQLIKEGKVEPYVKPAIQEDVVIETAPEVIAQPKKRGRKKK